MARVKSLSGDQEKFVNSMMHLLDEDQKRLFLAAYADYLGVGGATHLSEISGISQQTISHGRKQLETIRDENNVISDNYKRNTTESGARRIRAPGGGRKTILEKDPTIVDDLDKMLDGYTVGNPMNLLRWTTKSTRTLADALTKQGHKASYTTVGHILEKMGFSLQQNKKYTEAGNPDEDRNAQFEYINNTAAKYLESNIPVISVDTKKKENIGNFKNPGSEYRKKKQPRLVNDHDFCNKHANPYGIFDIGSNEGFVNVGISADTAEFAVESISNWWYLMGQYRYPDAKEVMITCDGGGSNGSRVRLWKFKLQELADYTGLTFHVSHFPPGTSKWNKIEHCLFSYISRNWKAQPLDSYETVVSLINATTNSKGLKVKCILDTWDYEAGKKVTDEEFATINITRNVWRGDWNYTISPRP